MLFIFAVVVTKEVLPTLPHRPGLVLGLIAIAFVICVILYVVTAAVFSRAGRRRAASIGFMTSQRNMGVIVGALGGAIPEVAWLYFALSQFPTYVAPYLLHPFTRAATQAPPEP